MVMDETRTNSKPHEYVVACAATGETARPNAAMLARICLNFIVQSPVFRFARHFHIRRNVGHYQPSLCNFPYQDPVVGVGCGGSRCCPLRTAV